MSEDQAKDDLLAEARSLIVGLIEERLEPSEAARLEQLVCEHAEVRALYAMYIHLRITMETVAQPVAGWQPAEGADVSHDSLHDTMVTPALHAETPDTTRPLRRPPPLMLGLQKTGPANFKPNPIRHFRGWAALIFLSLLSLLAILKLSSHPRTLATLPVAPISQPTMVATLTRTLDAKWSSTPPPAIGVQFPAQARLDLTGGFAEFTFASGADVVVQSPAEIVIQSNNSVTLQSGKLAATVPPVATGFAVSAGQSVITDLGTEFAVRESSAGTEVDVFKGKVTAQAPSTRPALLMASDAAHIDPGGKMNLEPGGAVPQRFVRQLQTDLPFLDLVDLAAGGDGTTARRGVSIDATTGKWGRLAPVGNEMGTMGYQRVGMTVIDGCFVPDGKLDKIDSGGDKFLFADAEGMTFNHILVGNKDNWPSTAIAGSTRFTAQLGGVDYSLAPHGFLFMHANSGLTFDLAAIAALHPDNRITGLHCLVGNCAPSDRNSLVNAYVFVDGVMRYKGLKLGTKSSPAVIDVPLIPTNRFLTLASCQRTGHSITAAWIMFADPHLNLSSSSPTRGDQ